MLQGPEYLDNSVATPMDFDIGIIHNGDIEFTVVLEFLISNVDENGAMMTEMVCTYVEGQEARDLMAAREMMQSLDASEESMNLHARSAFIKHWRINNAKN